MERPMKSIAAILILFSASFCFAHDGRAENDPFIEAENDSFIERIMYYEMIFHRDTNGIKFLRGGMKKRTT